MKAGRNAFVLVLATSLLGLGGVGVLASAGRAQGGELLAQTAKQRELYSSTTACTT